MDVGAQTMFIVGGTSGIGLEFARRLSAAGSTVVVGGRRRTILDELSAEGLGVVLIDVTDAGSVATARDEVLASYPDLSVVIAMSGVILTEDLRNPSDLVDAERMIATNLLGTIRVADAFLPHLLERGTGTIVTVGSAGAFVPHPSLPTYAATKAGVHVYTEVLRAQLADTGVHVVELVPPAVTTTAEREHANPGALPLAAFVDEALALFAADPTPDEILVERVLPFRWAERDGTYAALFAERIRAARDERRD